MPALQMAIDAVFDARVGDISGRGKLAADMREIWMMQPRFERRIASSAETLLGQPRFRAGFDFLRLRADAGEAEDALAAWWEDYSLAEDDATREALLEQARDEDQARRQGQPAPTAAARKRRRRRKPAGAAAGEGGAAPAAGGDRAAGDDAGA
jgi:poly(A) polymerase